MNLYTRGIIPVAILCIVLLVGEVTKAQLPTSCAGIGQRSNSNGGANSCPNNGGAMASNFSGTSYATIPGSAKTGNVQLSYTGTNASLLPYAITKVWVTTTGTSVQSVSFGPASPPVVSGGNTQVNYCFYGTNLPTAGTLSFELTNPQTSVVWGICSWDASCTSNCTVVANPTTLPVRFDDFAASAEAAGVVLKWTTGFEQNNRGFAVERSAGGGDFAQIAYVPSAHADGNSSNATSYVYTDKQAAGVDNLVYRIRQEDLDGHYAYSEVVKVSVQKSAVNVYAAGRQLNVQMPSGVGFEPCDVAVYDAGGRMLKLVHVERSGLTVIGGLPAHSLNYIVVRSGEGAVSFRKAVYVE